MTALQEEACDEIGRLLTRPGCYVGLTEPRKSTPTSALSKNDPSRPVRAGGENEPYSGTELRTFIGRRFIECDELIAFAEQKYSALKLPKQALNFMVLGVAARHMATDPNFSPPTSSWTNSYAGSTSSFVRRADLPRSYIGRGPTPGSSTRGLTDSTE